MIESPDLKHPPALKTGAFRVNIIKRIFTQRPLPPLWIVVIAYVLISPMTLLIPVNVFALYPWTEGFTDAVATVIPMIDRVVAYGHPHSDKLRCFLAYAWCCVPVLVWLLYRAADDYNKPLAWGEGWLDFWARWIAMVALIACLAFLTWYWPNFPGAGKDVFGPIARPHDERRQLLWSSTSLLIYTPIWITCFAGLIDSARCEFLNFLWRVGVVKAYPSISLNPDSTPTSK